MLTLFHPATGRVRLEGTTSCPNDVLHGWLRRELSEVLAGMPDPPPTAETSRGIWLRWQQGLSVRITLPTKLPALRVPLVLDNLAGHKTHDLVLWLFAHGFVLLYTLVDGSWLNVAESRQRILKRRALDGQESKSLGHIAGWFAAAAGHWYASPTPFEWGGKRRHRRERQQAWRHRLGGSGAVVRNPVAARPTRRYGHAQVKCPTRSSSQVYWPRKNGTSFLLTSW